MSQIPPLFEDADDADRTLDEAQFGVVSHLRALWQWFHPYADPTFVSELRSAVQRLRDNPTRGQGRDEAYFLFQRRYWEMYTGCGLLDQGVELTPWRDRDRGWQGAGPDLMATVENRRVWMECVAPGPGTGPDGVPELGDGPVKDVPVEQIKLRFLSVFNDKRKQLRGHLKAGIVAPEDGFIVAINSKCIPFAFLTEEPPWIARALYGLGNHAVTINAATSKCSDPFLVPQLLIAKANNQAIEADLFGSGKAPEVSGVLYSAVDAWNRKRNLAHGLVFVHNRTAAVPLPDRWLPFSVSYSVCITGITGTISRADPDTGSKTALG